MSILSLPPELLYYVFSHILGSGPSNPLSYPAIAHDLCTFCLVHSTWRKPAQATLQEEVFAMVNSTSEEAERMIKEKGCLLVEKGVRGTKFLTIVGNLESFLEATGDGMWTEVVVLQFQHRTKPLALIGIEFFSRFPSELSRLFPVPQSNGTIKLTPMSRSRKALSPFRRPRIQTACFRLFLHQSSHPRSQFLVGPRRHSFRPTTYHLTRLHAKPR